MSCDCASLRAEIISQRSEINSQRKLLLQLFQFVTTEFQEVKKQNSEIISKFNEFKVNQHDATTAQPSILEPSASKPFPASLFLEKILGNPQVAEPLHDNPGQFGMSTEPFGSQEPFKVAESNSQPLSTTNKPNAKDSSDKFQLFGAEFDREKAFDEQASRISPNMDDHSLPIMGGISFEIVPKTEKEDPASSSNQPNKGKLKRFRCSECCYETNNSNHIVIHRRTHTGERSFACDQCDFRTTRKYNLTTHQRTHTGEKPFQCDQCPYSSAQKTYINMHKRTHTGEKPYQCELCDYRTAFKANIDYHRSHKH